MKINKRKTLALLTAGLLAVESLLVIPGLADGRGLSAASSSTGVKYGTPVLDGVLDGIYSGTATLNTIDFAKSGNMSLGMPSFSSSKANAYVSAGILSSTSSTTLKPSGNYNITAFPKAEISFLWDKEAIYVFSKVYDPDILVPNQSTITALSGDQPWLTDSVTNIIYPDGNPYAQMNVYGLAGGVACWDNISWNTTDRRPGGWTTIGYFTGATAQQKENNRKHVASVVNRSGGYYTVEMKIPFSSAEFGGEPLYSAVLKPGGKFEYRFYVTDGENGLQSNGYHGNNFAIYMSDVGTTFTLLGCQSASDHVWGGYEVDTLPTCTSEGRESVHCTICGGSDSSTSRSIAKLAHNSVTTSTEASCTAPATSVTRCAVCGYSETVTVSPALGHSYVNGSCSRCGDRDTATNVKLTASAVTGYPGETVQMSLELSEAVEIKSMIVYDFVYDKTVMTLKDVQWCVPDAVIADYDPTADAAVLAMNENTDMSGAVLTLTFGITEGADGGEYTVSATAKAKTKPAGGIESDIGLSFEDGAITVSDGIRYDINGDGGIDSDDALYLLRALYMPESYPLEQSGDVNADGAVDSDDVIWLLEYSFN